MTTTATKPTDTGPVFYLSYPRPPAAERFWSADVDYVAFYHELCAALARAVPLDRLHGLGSLSPQWDSADAAATEHAARDIAECDVFVPLRSPRYFESDDCGRELAAFEERVSRATAPTSDAIVPVLWAPVSPQWDVIKPPPYRSWDGDLDEQYLAKGLIGLQSRDPERYRKVVAGLARRIADISAGRPVSSGPAADVPTLRSTLRKAERQPLVVVLLAPTTGRPPGAGRPGYGDSAVDWAPFAVEAGAAPLAGQVETLARAKGWEPRVVPFSENDPRLFGESDLDAQTVLVVDVRALDDRRWRAALQRFDRLDKPGVGVVAACDPAATSTQELARLRNQLMQVLERRFARRSPSLRMSAPIATSLRTFDQALDATANDTRIRLANYLLNRNSHPAEEENLS